MIIPAFRALQMAGRLKASERGLSSQHQRQLYTGCVLLILDFEAGAWGGGQKEYIDKLQKLQNTACGRILGAFRTSLVTPMELRASLPLPIRLQETYRKSALQTVPDHPIQLRTSSTFPPEYHSRINVEHNKHSQDIEDKTHSQLWRIHHIVANLTPSPTQLETIDHLTNLPWLRTLDPSRVSIHIP